MAEAAHRRRAARAAYKGGEFVLATREYEQLFAGPDPAADPAQQAQDRLDYGGALIKSGRVADAVAAFERAVALTPQDVRARVKLAQTLSRLERHPEAVEQFRRVVEQAPEDADAHAMLGTELRWTGQTGEARAELERALSLDPDHVDARLTLMALGRPREFSGMDLLDEGGPPPDGGAVPSRQFDAAPIRSQSQRQHRTPVWLLVTQAVGLAVAGVWLRSLLP